eukprot:TRINITY_DN2613_c0_g1_i3.p1 TRINITY_DN2613_c0_g1~~TRINITY_DN2613_c0_g1_i3.p1  ORF type:complete len:194 (+),score=2.82 TRINITY_DN2613_c0_g1_i3:32-613(+)
MTMLSIFKSGKGEIFIGITLLGGDYVVQSINNIFPILIYDAKESNENYKTVFSLLNDEIKLLQSEGIEFIICSDLKILGHLAKFKSQSQICPYCDISSKQKDWIQGKVRSEFDSTVVSCFASSRQFIYCTLHGFSRCTERMLQLTLNQAIYVFLLINYQMQYMLLIRHCRTLESSHSVSIQQKTSENCTKKIN